MHSESGQVESVKYEELIPILLNEIKHQRRELGARLELLEEGRAVARR